MRWQLTNDDPDIDIYVGRIMIARVCVGDRGAELHRPCASAERLEDHARLKGGMLLLDRMPCA